MACEYCEYSEDECDCILCRTKYVYHPARAFIKCLDEDSHFYDCRNDGLLRTERGYRSYVNCPVRNFALSINYDPKKVCHGLKLEYYGYKRIIGKCGERELSVNEMKNCMCSGSCSNYAEDKRNNENEYFSFCYISTACVVAKGLPDDCDELQTLRVFRDKMVKEDEAIAELVKEYYKNAPVIVEKINQENNSEEIYNFLYNNLVLACVTKLKENKIQDAVDIYTSIYQDLKKKYI